MLAHCYPVLRWTAAAVAQPVRRLARRATGPSIRRPRHGTAAITEVCRRVPGTSPAWSGVLPAFAGAGAAGFALAGLIAAGFGTHERSVGGAGGAYARHDAAIPSGAVTPGALDPALLTVPDLAFGPGEPDRPAPVAVAEPAALLLLAVGGLGAVAARRSGRRPPPRP